MKEGRYDYCKFKVYSFHNALGWEHGHTNRRGLNSFGKRGRRMAWGVSASTARLWRRTSSIEKKQAVPPLHSPNFYGFELLNVHHHFSISTLISKVLPYFLLL